MSSPQILSGVRVPPSLVLCVMLSRSSFCPFSVDHRVVCPFDYTFGIHKLLLDFHRKMGYVGKRLVANDNENKKFHSIISRSNVMYIFHYSAQQTTVSFWEVFVPLFTI